MNVTKLIQPFCRLLAAAVFTISITGAAHAADFDEEHAPALTEAALHSLLAQAGTDDPFADRSSAWWDYLGKQLDASLRSRIDGVRHQALQLTITFALRYPEKINLRRAIPELAYVYTFEPDARYRVMALSAMHAIGGKYSMQMLPAAN